MCLLVIALVEYTPQKLSIFSFLLTPPLLFTSLYGASLDSGVNEYLMEHDNDNKYDKFNKPMAARLHVLRV